MNLLKKVINKYNKLRGNVVLTLIFIYLSFYFQLSELWGALFLIWAVIDVIKEETWLTESVTKIGNPILYWIVVMTWFISGILVFIYPVTYHFITRGS